MKELPAFKPKIEGAPILTILGALYPLVSVYFLFGWQGSQYIPLDMPRTYYLFYALLFAFGSVSIWAIILKWKMWGVYGIVTVWFINGLINILIGAPMDFIAVTVTLLIIGGFLWDIRRLWQYLS